MPEPSAPIVITGMHRSGTSLVASLLQHSGLNIGQNLIQTNQDNVHGYFEDTNFVYFHAQALQVFLSRMNPTRWQPLCRLGVKTRMTKPVWWS